MKYRIVTLGCKVNTYESEAVKSMFISRGYVDAKTEKADIVLINTCTVTSVSDQKSRQKIRSEIAKNEGAIVIVMGCYTQMSSEFVATIPGISIILGTNSRHLIPDLIDEYIEKKQLINKVESNRRDFSFESLNVTSYSDNTRAFLKIQDGCDNFCSYCIIPFARGRLRSRAKEDVIKEIKQLVAKGFKEIVLTGIHTAGYGRDFDKYTFTDLVRDILSIENLRRLRISSIEASEITDELIELIKNNDIIARHLHIPLQSGSEEVLKRMNRKYNKDFFLKRIEEIKSHVLGIALTTDVIVGFPQETEEEFVETYDFIKQCGFNELHVFPYSPRNGTPAASMKNQVDSTVKKDRVHRLIELSEELKGNYSDKFIGTTQQVLIETLDELKNVYKGYTSNYLDAFIKSDTDLRGQMVEIIYNKMKSVKK